MKNNENLKLALIPHWNDEFLIGHPAMDAKHEEFFELVRSLAESDENSLSVTFAALAAHLRSHFDGEHSLMSQTDFPAIDCHRDEHAQVLEAIQKVEARLKTGTLALHDAHRLALALAEWFPGHLAYMDSALATWVSKIKHGGAPIVLKRNQAPHPPLHVSRHPAE